VKPSRTCSPLTAFSGPPSSTSGIHSFGSMSKAHDKSLMQLLRERDSEQLLLLQYRLKKAFPNTARLLGHHGPTYSSGKGSRS